ncbi:biotin transporter BioY [bacterium]|nr:biotin transporter BioY [bacterium]NIN93187.1 biotin transporter BioY [bacterium]NIO18984.1 biotin transporter BioY [bacterium]NIO74113.1 biotin transporter BioY [bacterium]
MKLKTDGMILCALFAALTGVGGLIAIPLPFTPVPITLQTFFTFLAGAILGKYLGSLSQLIYLLLGIIGLPVFAKGSSGLGVLLGPTGGYLVGFVPAAFLIGWILEKKEKPPYALIFLAMVVGLLAIYLPGVGWLMWVARMNLVKALFLGALPFLPGDVVKIVVGALIVGRAMRLRKAIRV